MARERHKSLCVWQLQVFDCALRARDNFNKPRRRGGVLAWLGLSYPAGLMRLPLETNHDRRLACTVFFLLLLLLLLLNPRRCARDRPASPLFGGLRTVLCCVVLCCCVCGDVM